MCVLLCFSISARSRRFSFNKNAPIARGTCTRITALRSLRDSSSITRRIARASDRVSRIRPWPLQRGHNSVLISSSEGRSRCRLISIKPKREMRPVWMRARSVSSALRIRFSTARWFLVFIISMKSITTRPPMSRIFSCRAISSAASKLVFRAVSSISEPLVARAELISMDTNASVGSMTILPPDGSLTVCS